jgi:plasmid stabilization system protein ParE
MGRRVPEAQEQREIREILFQGYRIIYRLAEQRVQILSVLHGSRDLLQREPKPWEIL